MADKSLLIANRYSKALIEISKDGLMSNSDISSQLLFIKEVLDTSSELKEVLLMPQVSLASKKEILDEVFKSHINILLLNFLKVLVEQDRFYTFDDIVRAYQDFSDELNNINRVQIVSAVELTEEQKIAIQTKLQKKLKGDIAPDWDIDPAILAGLVFKYDGNVIDTSLRNKLNDLNRNIVRI